jgi:ABC-type lipoprotein export system ATPase subunit
MSGAAVELVDVRKRYVAHGGTIDAVAGVSLRIDPGDRVAITGPSGCGKSTLLGLIAGLGLVFQSDDLLPFLTATENVSAQLALGDATGEHTGSVELLTSFALVDELDRLPDELSGGQRQRVAVARSLVHRPRLVVADEPTGSLDPANAQAVVDLLLEAQRETGATLVLVTHEVAVADRLDRVVSMADGRLVTDAQG